MFVGLPFVSLNWSYSGTPGTAHRRSSRGSGSKVSIDP
jgi:hypothetical protein